MEQDAFGPAFTGAEHIAIAEAATGRQHLEIGQAGAPGHQIAHVDVVGIETGAGKGGGHFHLAVDALLAQHGDFGLVAADKRRGDVVANIKAQVGKQGAAAVVAQKREFAVGAGGVVAQALDLVAGFAPGFLQFQAAFVQQYGVAVVYH